jgi:hypothetical protein
VKLLKGIFLGGVVISASQIFAQQVFAQEDTASEIRLLKAKLKELEQRVEVQGRKERRYEAQAEAIIQAPPAYKAAPSAFDPCPAGKVCYKGVTLTLRRIGKSQGGIHRCRHGAVRLRQPALQQHRLQRREFTGGNLQRQYARDQANHRRVLRFDLPGQLRHAQSRRAVFLQSAPRLRGCRWRTEDRRPNRHDASPLLSVLNSRPGKP